MSLKCLVHTDDKSCEAVKPLDQAKWERLKSVVNIRKTYLKKTKYDSIVSNFPEDLNASFGYHSTCYKNFTAVPKPEATPSPSSTPNVNTRSQNSSTGTSSSGVLPPSCIFCGYFRSRSNESVGSAETKDAEINIREAARQKNDVKLLSLIGNYLFSEGPDFVALEAKYHHSCRRQYLNKARDAKDNVSKKVSAKAFKTLCQHVKDSVLVNNIPELVSSLLKRYHDSYISFGGQSSDLESYTGQNLCKRLRGKFSESELTMWSEKHRHGALVCKFGTTEDEAQRLLSSKSESEKSVMRSCAEILRRSIFTSKKYPLNTDSAESVMKGEVEVPNEVNYFYTKLYNDDENGRKTKKIRRRLVQSSTADAVFNCSGSKLLPGKHISLGLTLKSISGSKRVVNLMNRYGHCVSNETLRRIDMGIEESVNMEQGDVVPDGIHKRSGKCTGSAFDNFDVNVETLNGLGTVHHTYGIVYQNIFSNVDDTTEDVSSSTPRPSGKRTFKQVTPTTSDDIVEPYHKKPKISHHEFLKVEFLPPDTLSSDINLLWVICKSLFPYDIPNWSGWNAQRDTDRNPKQVVRYLKPIPLPPTRTDVVKETLNRALKIAEECGDDHALVTYDLAVAKIAKQIQDTEQPLYDKVFIMFGSFHVEMSFFGALGRLIEGSGGPYVMTEEDVIAPGSLNKFLKGKQYNRCRRAHILFATAMHSLHFERFVAEEGLTESTKTMLKTWALSDDMHQNIPDDLQLLVTKYFLYCDDTLSGARGKTAQFWMIYCSLMDTYLLFHHSVKTNDVDLFAYALHDMTKIFFSTNHFNYARWMTRYALELLNIDESLKETLRNGGFSVKRTNNPYSRVGVDMALEQTINAEAKNRLKGIMSFADANTAVNRWVVTNTMRSEIVQNVLVAAGLSPDDDATVPNKETQPRRMQRDAEDFVKLAKSVKDMLNPFDVDINKEALFNIKTGKKASAGAEKYLLNVLSEGEARRDQFSKECQDDASRFEKSINKCVIVNFATDSFTKKNKSTKAYQIAQLKGTRDLFARLLFLAVKKNLNAEKVLEYPLIPIPPELAHPDGSMRTTTKSSVMEMFELETRGPEYVDNIIVDGMFLLRNLVVPLPHNLRGLVRHIMMKVLKMTQYRGDMVFDTYNSPCLKDITREIRTGGFCDEDVDSVYSFGGGQKTPNNFLTLLKSSNFKKEFLRFLFAEVRNPELSEIVGHKILYISVDNECIRVENDVNTGDFLVSECLELFGDHDEADTRVAFHARHVERFDPGNTVIRCNDTDIFTIMLVNHEHFQASRVWLDVGLDYNNSRKFIDVKATAAKISYVKALPGIYGISGLDFIPAFLRKGKKKPIKVMLKKDKFIAAFTRFGEEDITKDDISTIEEFTCHLFGFPKVKSINEARFIHFQNKCKPKSSEKPLDCIKSVDPSMFPPCRSVLLEQIKRAWLVARLYRNATLAEPLLDVSPLDYGYELIDGRIQVKWFLGEQVPAIIEEDGDSDGDAEDKDKDEDSDDSDVSEDSEDSSDEDSSDEDSDGDGDWSDEEDE